MQGESRTIWAERGRETLACRTAPGQRCTVSRMTTRTKIGVGVGTLVLALAVSLLGSLHTGPAVTMDLLSYTNGRITVNLVNNGRVPVLCQGVGTCWIEECNDITLRLEARTQRRIVSMRCNVGVTGPSNFRWDPAPVGRFDVRCYPVNGTLRKRINQVLLSAGFKVTNTWFLVSAPLPPPGWP